MKSIINPFNQFVFKKSTYESTCICSTCSKILSKYMYENINNTFTQVVILKGELPFSLALQRWTIKKFILIDKTIET